MPPKFLCTEDELLCILTSLDMNQAHGPHGISSGMITAIYSGESLETTPFTSGVQKVLYGHFIQDGISLISLVYINNSFREGWLLYISWTSDFPWSYMVLPHWNYVLQGMHIVQLTIYTNDCITMHTHRHYFNFTSHSYDHIWSMTTLSGIPTYRKIINYWRKLTNLDSNFVPSNGN